MSSCTSGALVTTGFLLSFVRKVAMQQVCKWCVTLCPVRFRAHEGRVFSLHRRVKKYIYPIRFRAPEAEEVVVGAPSSKQDYLTIQTLAAPPPPPARSSEQGRKMDKTRGGWKSLNQIRRINFNDIYFKSNLIGHECKYGLNFFFTLKYLNIMCIILSIKFLISNSPPPITSFFDIVLISIVLSSVVETPIYSKL